MMGLRLTRKTETDGGIKNELGSYEAGVGIYYSNINFQQMPEF